LLIAFLAFPAQSRLYTINTGWTEPVSSILNEIIVATFERAKLDVEFHLLPAERSLVQVKLGTDDGDCCRVASAIKKDYPDLLQVPEVVYNAKFSVFSKKPHPKIESFDALKPYSVATVSGWKILVNNLNRVQPETLHIMNEPKAMFKILDQDRIDMAAYGYVGGIKEINDLGLKNISPIEPPLAQLPLYLYLHKKNKDIIPLLTKALRELKAEGVIDKIMLQYSSN